MCLETDRNKKNETYNLTELETKLSESLGTPQEMATLIISNMSKVIKEVVTQNVEERGEASNSVPSQVNSIELDMSEVVKHMSIERKFGVFRTWNLVGRNLHTYKQTQRFG